MNVTAVVDRLEGELAVLLVGPEGKPVAWPLSCLPSVHEGSVLQMKIETDERRETECRQNVQDLLKKLTERGRPV